MTQLTIFEQDLVSNQRIEFIDFAKGFAISTIVLMHALTLFPLTPLFGKFITAGGAGVHLFILLSGFGLALSRQVSTIEFFKRRFIKILVPYYICITTIFILNLLFQFYPTYGFYAYLGHIFLFKMFDETIMTSFGYHFWFVSTIIQLYVLYPVLVIWKEKFGIRTLLIVSMALSLLWWIGVAQTGLYTQRIFGSFFLQYLWEFVLGIYIAGLYQQKGIKLWEAKSTIVAIIGVPALILYGSLPFIGNGSGKIFNDAPALLGYSCVCLSFFRLLNQWQSVKNISLLIGKHSYMVYLWHGLFLAVIVRISKLV